jgi:hypothetical protein
MGFIAAVRPREARSAFPVKPGQDERARLPARAKGASVVRRVGQSAKRRAHAADQRSFSSAGGLRFALLSPPYEARKKEGKRNADRRVVANLRTADKFTQSAQTICSDAAARAGGTRSPVGVPPRLFAEVSEHLHPASGQASWDAAATITLLSGCCPPLPVPVQRHPRPATHYRRHDAQSRPGEACETARGHRTRSVCRIASGTSRSERVRGM